MFLKIIASASIGYLLGSVVWAILISLLVFKEDIRSKGSGNSGATNAARVYGFWFGWLTFWGDFSKGVAACALGGLIGGAPGLAAAGLACMLGHRFPLYFRFRGGKCVSVGLALALMIDYRIALAAIGVFLVMFLITRIVSLGSIAGAATVGAASVMIAPELVLKISGVIAAIAVIALHHSNIKRLLRGEEKKITFGKRK